MNGECASFETPHILFDMDGVLIDNFAYELRVQHKIFQELADRRGIELDAACQLWVETVTALADHPRRSDYALLCGQLGLGEVWLNAHRTSLTLLKTFSGTNEAIAVVRTIGPCWIVSDAIDSVVRLKLSTLGLLSQFEMIWSLNSCGSHKGTAAFWNAVVRQLGGRDQPVIYVDDRPDCLAVAQSTLTRCTCLLLPSTLSPECIPHRYRALRPHEALIECQHEALSAALLTAAIHLRRARVANTVNLDESMAAPQPPPSLGLAI